MADETNTERGLAQIHALVAQAKEAFKPGGNAIEVPAVPGKESVKILPKAVFWKTSEQEQIAYEPDKYGDRHPVNVRTKKPFYSSYLMETKNGQILFVTAPVALIDDHVADREVLTEMEAQGFKPTEVWENCRMDDVESTFSFLDARRLPALRKIIRDGFVSQGFNNRTGYIDSGWIPNSGRQRLDLVGKEFVSMGSRMNPYFTASPYETYSTGIHPISKPLSTDTTDPLEKEIYRRVLEVNK